MENVLRGILSFKKNRRYQKEELFRKLSKGQTPTVMLITCSDSRIQPDIITRTEPGEIFVVRNMGNLIPAKHESEPGAESAAIDYAINVLNIRDIVICGHTKCGAVHGLLHPQTIDSMPAIKNWLDRAGTSARTRIEALHQNPEDPNLWRQAVDLNVLAQLENLRSHDSVQEALRREILNIHGWVYEIETGEIQAYEPHLDRFLPLEQSRVATSILGANNQLDLILPDLETVESIS
ncbi:carbonic anhydrase [Telmatocola sphagniphila]|uniref:carbonic anhydrase n=1 Tax=Telmatocola sphagniphila TaxID=1123043 RepID=A0A8E6EWR9_9BACT|nr:carbonic anhydrase [Telmatocola sphagniphila]QVL30446.1 carbonic anhydrase [Telmatocola sphagniphila]